MPGELGNEETSDQVGHYDSRYEHRVHQPGENPKPAYPGLNKKIREMSKNVVRKHLERDQDEDTPVITWPK